MNNLIEAKLKSMFAAIREQAFTRLHESRVRWAVCAHESFVAALAGPPKSLLYFRRPEYTKPASGPVVAAPGFSATNEERWAHMGQQTWEIDYDRIRADVNREIDDMGRMFVLRVGTKLSLATQLQTTDPSIRGNIAVDWPAVVGDVDLDYPGASLTANVKVITNYRNGNPYYQFPCRYKQATVGGELKIAPSQEWLETSFA